MKYIIQYIILLLVVLQSAYGQQTDSRNYVIVRNYKQAGASPDNVSQVSIQVQYLDGLGRPLQNVSVKQSPDGLDVIQATEYDAAGRQAKQYLPYVAPSGTGAYRSGALSEVGAWYTANSALLKTSDLNRPYVETSFDQSPLNRLSAQRAPGNNSTNSTTKYKVNTASEIKRYDHDPSTNVIGQVGYYYEGRLTRNQFTDEQGNEVNEYTDKLGKVIAKQVEDSGITYYVYDNRGLLRGVLQPNFQDSGSYADFAFIYDYDNLDRMISKTIPGSGKTDMVYDNFDRPVLSQDANQLARGVWAFTKYDALNRAVMTGEVTSGNTRGTWQTSFNGTSTHHEDKQGSGVGYTLSNTLPAISESEILNVTYYDDYSFPGVQAYGHAFSVPGNAAVKGQPTGSRTRMLNTGAWLVSTIRYDAEYRPIEVVRELPDLGAAITTERVSTAYKYDLAPVVAQQQTDHLSSATGPIINSHWKVFQYDHADRLLSVTEKVKLGALEKQAATVAHRYNTLGQLQSKWIHSDDLLQFRLRTDYTNNIRGWITDGKTVYKQIQGGPDNPFFSYGLSYANGSSYTNGNISQMQWNGKDEAAFTKGLSFAYDGANRLTGSTGLSGYGDTESGITYDKNGNIKTLVRAGVAVDNLGYTYAGNRLTGINDATGSNTGVKGGSSSYGYDGNGNMISDGNRGATLTYNYLNLPKTVVIGGKTLAYDYDASGSKHKYVADTLTVKYEGGFEYNAVNAFKRLALSEGQAVLKNNAIVFEYYLKDHLDNVRVVFNEKGDILQKNDFYPFGLEIDRNSPVQTLAARNGINRYNFLGKETQVATGYIDLQARFYDPTIGRFMAVDPETDGQDEFSPYHYSFNNPIRFSDPDGRWPECCKGLVDFATGVGQAVNDDMGWGNPVQAQPGHVDKYNNGRTVGHVFSVVLGAGEVAAGALGLTASAGAEIGSAGLATPVVVVAAGASAGLVAHGGNAAMNAIDNLKNDKGRVNADSHPNSNKTSGNNSAAQNGQQKHKELSAKVQEKAKTKPGWESQPSITGKDGKTHRPDVQTPSGNLLEYKPRTPTGISKGKTQAKRYENQTGQKTRVIYYDN
jgi:RHS repeat-associated protein